MRKDGKRNCWKDEWQWHDLTEKRKEEEGWRVDGCANDLCDKKDDWKYNKTNGNTMLAAGNNVQKKMSGATVM